MMSYYPLTSKTQNVSKIKAFDNHQSMYGRKKYCRKGGFPGCDDLS